MSIVGRVKHGVSGTELSTTDVCRFIIITIIIIALVIVGHRSLPMYSFLLAMYCVPWFYLLIYSFLYMKVVFLREEEEEKEEEEAVFKECFAHT